MRGFERFTSSEGAADRVGKSEGTERSTDTWLVWSVHELY